MGDAVDRFAFSGRKGTLPLSDFICMYEGVMREKKYQVPNFTQRSAFEFLGPYHWEDPLKLFHRRYHTIMELTEQAPALPAVELVEEQLEQFARRAIPAALDEAGNVLRPAIPALPYLPYIAPVAPREAQPAGERLLEDPLHFFFELLRTDYRFKIQIKFAS